VTPVFERLGTGFLFTEGPVWHPIGKFLLFSDMPGDHLRRWSAADGVTTFRKPCNMSNGLTYDCQRRLIACEHASSQLIRTEVDGRIVPLATHYQGIYFSDPPYGRAKFYGVERLQELPFQGVYRVGSDPRSPVLLVDDFDRPNGLCFSLDETRLFVNDTARKHIRVFDVAPDGSLRHGRVWAETKGDKPGAPDGMKLDAAGNVYCCGPGGIHVFDPDANLLEVLEVPEYTANFAWGDDDYRSLFITASTSLYRTRRPVPGRPVF
jgi:gluconolactonase